MPARSQQCQHRALPHIARSHVGSKVAHVPIGTPVQPTQQVRMLVAPRPHLAARACACTARTPGA
eukprot:13650763-Alexandrium_andersonii.AAC.1